MPIGTQVTKALNAVTISTEQTVWTPTSGKRFRLMGYCLALSAAGNVLLRDNTAGTIIAVIPSAAGGQAIPSSFGEGILSAAANNVLTAQGSVSGTVSGTLWGYEE